MSKIELFKPATIGYSLFGEKDHVVYDSETNEVIGYVSFKNELYEAKNIKGPSTFHPSAEVAINTLLQQSEKSKKQLEKIKERQISLF